MTTSVIDWEAGFSREFQERKNVPRIKSALLRPKQE